MGEKKEKEEKLNERVIFYSLGNIFLSFVASLRYQREGRVERKEERKRWQLFLQRNASIQLMRVLYRRDKIPVVLYHL